MTFLPPDFETSLERLAQILSPRRSPPPAVPSEPDASFTASNPQTPVVEVSENQSDEHPSTSH